MEEKNTQNVMEQGPENSTSDKKKKRLFDLLLIVGILFVIGAGGALLWLKANNEASKDIYDGLKNQFVSTHLNQTTEEEPENSTESDERSTEEPTEEDTEASTEASSEELSTEESVTEEPTTEEPTTEAPTQPESESILWYQMIAVDFDGLRQVNPEVVGWIYFENEDISYPILYSGDNEKYLRTDIYGNVSTAGCIYMDGENSPEFDDRRTVLYGHNMKNLTMFGKLKYYVERSDYYVDHQYFQIHEDDVIHRYRIFSFFPVNENEVPMVRVSYGENDDIEFEFLLGQLQERSQWGTTGVEVNVDDHVLTLVTCFTEGHRVLINAVRVDSYPLQ